MIAERPVATCDEYLGWMMNPTEGDWQRKLDLIAHVPGCQACQKRGLEIVALRKEAAKKLAEEAQLEQLPENQAVS